MKVQNILMKLILWNRNILNILNELSFVKSALIITTDKVYFNNNKKNILKKMTF
jgi:hypothetical protein